jgi:hypothetical protein
VRLSRRRAATGTRPADEDDPSLAAAFIESTFGLPPDGASEDHAEGYVAEIAWRMLTHEEQGDSRYPIQTSPIPAGTDS